MKRRTRVLLADDSPEISELYRDLIGDEADLECVGTMGTATGLQEEIISRQPDVVVVDLTMPGDDPLEAIRSASTRFPECGIIAFSGYDDPWTRERALGAGARAMVSKADHPARLVEVIRRIGGLVDGGPA